MASLFLSPVSSVLAPFYQTLSSSLQDGWQLKKSLVAQLAAPRISSNVLHRRRNKFCFIFFPEASANITWCLTGSDWVTHPSQNVSLRAKIQDTQTSSKPGVMSGPYLKLKERERTSPKTS